MRLRLATVLAILVALGAGCQVSRALKQSIPASAAVGTQDERTQRISAVIRDTMRKEHIPGVAVAVIDGGAIVWAQGFGWRDVGKRLPVDTDTQFQVASISKPVTLRMLLCHRAGMVPHGFLGYSGSKAPPTLLEVLGRRNALADWLTGNYLGSVKVKYPPDTEFRYSGGGYCVVQKVVEDVTGEPFDTVMSKTLLEPLQMSRSHFHQPPPEQETENTARGRHDPITWLRSQTARRCSSATDSAPRSGRESGRLSACPT
ncbi:MAG: beta-lactamase family protein [Planctomycetes bacterium]|nr:beta-lactamase family protein [Planctomycetota bacterium]